MCNNLDHLDHLDHPFRINDLTRLRLDHLTWTTWTTWTTLLESMTYVVVNLDHLTIERFGGYIVTMNPKHELFCYELIKQNFNQTRAYMAVYPDSSREAAGRSAHVLMNNPEIQQFVNELMEERIASEGLQVADIVRKLWRRATANPNELTEVRRSCCRYCWGRDHQYQHTPAQWQQLVEDYQAAVAGAERTKKQPPEPPPVRGGVGFDKRMPPNENCPECFGEGVEDIIIKDTRTLSPEARELFAGVKMTRNGIEMLMNSQDAAIEKLGRHLAMFTDNVNHKNNGGSFKPLAIDQFYNQPLDDEDGEPPADT